MKKAPGFELVEVADDYLLVPVGEQMDRFNGTVVLNEVSAFLFEKMGIDRTVEELIQLLTAEFDVDEEKAIEDITITLEKMKEIGVIND